MNRRDIPVWIGLAFCIVMLILELITGREIFFYLLDAGLIFTLGYHMGNIRGKITSLDGRISGIEGDIKEMNSRIFGVEGDIKEMRGDIRELLKHFRK